MDSLSEEELLQFKEWITMKKETAEYLIWKRKQAERAEDAALAAIRFPKT
jgi:hypothetical protein